MDAITGMTLTGCDTIVFTSVGIMKVFSSLNNQLEQRWPSFFVDLEIDGRSIENLTPQEVFANLQEDHRNGHVVFYFFRDIEMKQHLIGNGYTLQECREGPAAVHFRERKGIRFLLGQLTEVLAADRRPNDVRPYSAWLCCREINEITVVTPDEPNANELSRLLVETVIKACTTV